MRVVIQRVERATVAVDGRPIAAIEAGLAVLVGVADPDEPADAHYLADKIANLRIMNDDRGRMNRSVGDAGGDVLLVPQFTLIAETRAGRRPDFTGAARPDRARPLIAALADDLRARGLPVQLGQFGAHMAVSLINDGPVTIVLDSADRHIPRRRA